MSNIAVYAKGTTDFFNQGLGILSDAISSDTTQTVSSSGNVQSELELSYPVGGYLSEQLIEGNFLRVSMAVDSSKYAVFEIIDSIKDDSGTLTIYGAPYSDRIGRMSFDNGGKFGSYSSVQAALNYAKSQMKDFPSWFQLTSNISKAVDFTNDGIVKDFATFLDLLNQKVSGNVYYGLNIIQIYSALGKDRTDIILRDDRNTNSVKVKTDYSSIINRVIPVLPVLDKDGNATQETKVGTIVNSKTPNQFLDYWAGLAVQLDTQDLANSYFDRTHADRPVQTVDVDPIGMDEDFSDIDIFDRVQLYSTKLKYTDKLRVSKRVIDNLTGMVTSFSLGSSSVTLNNTIQQVQNDIANQIQAITSVVISASGKNQTYISNVKPTSANEGDMWIQEDGDYQAFWVYKNGDWVRLVDSNTQKDITDGVNKAIEQAKLDAQGIVDSNNTVIRAEMQTVATQKAQDEIAKGNFDANAQAYANSAKSAAIAQAQSLVQTQAQQAAKDLSDARLSIQNDINITNGNVKSLTDRADGWDATVTKVNNLSVGGRNLLLNSKDFGSPWNGFDAVTPNTYQALSATQDTRPWAGPKYSMANLRDRGVINDTDIFIMSGYVRNTGDNDLQLRFYATDNSSAWTTNNNEYISIIKAHSDWVRVSTKPFKFVSLATMNSVGIRFESGDTGANGYLKQAGLKLEKGSIATDWSPAPEDLSAASAQAQLTADKAALDLKNYQVSNDGSVKKAQSDITVLAGKVETKVSQVDYDSNNKTLNQNISTATQTATQAQQTINSYKTTTDGKLQTMSGQIDTVAGSVALAATKTELNTAKSEFSSQVSSVKADYNSVTQSVSEVKGTLNDLQQVNLINNSDFSPDLGGWTTRGAGNYTTGDYDYFGGVYVVEATTGGFARTNSAPISLNGNGAKVYSLSFNLYIFTLPSGGRVTSQLTFLDSNLNETSSTYPAYQDLTGNGTGKWANIKTNAITFTPPAGAEYVVFSFDARGVGTKAGFNRPILVVGSTVGNYVRGQYSNNDKIALQQITINSISSIVSDPTTGLSTRVQTAEGLLTQVRGTDIPALQKATFWQPYSSLNFNDYTKQGSYFFNTTSEKTNGPVSWNNSWTYLMVEEGMGSARIKQTAWYDGTGGIKITYVRTLNSGIWSPWYANDNDSVATISVMNGQISQEISDRKTGDSNTLTQAKDYTTSQINSAVSGVNSTISQTASAILANISATNLFLDSEFNQDYGARSKSGTISYLSNQNVDGQYHGIVQLVTTSTAYQGYWGKNIPVQGGAKYSGSVRVHFNNNGISNGTAMYDLWFVDKSGNRISQGTGASSSKNTTKMISSPYWIDLWIDGITAPINAVYAQVSLLAVGGTGMLAQFTMPTFTATDVHQPYSPNDDVTTQLALLKDKWSIGIADNIGNIVSGIAGNSAQMAIISDKVIIKSPNTQITGTAWINSAMIANGAIGTAQIGDASITSAKILSLDVNKLSGNISNFIQSNWNGTYGSTKITSSGMTITTSGAIAEFINSGMQLTKTNEMVGGIGVQGMLGMADNYQGLTFWLNGVGDYMGWAARDNGNTTANPSIKLGWYRGGSYTRPSGSFPGFNFNDDVVFNNYIKVAGGTNQSLQFDTHRFNNNNYPAMMDNTDGAGFAWGSSQMYIISGSTFWNLTALVKALSGFGNIAIPTGFNSDGTAKGWFNTST